MASGTSAQRRLVNRCLRLAVTVGAVIMALAVCLIATGVVPITPEQGVIGETFPLPPTTTPSPTRF
jgi:hypothetical protein